MSMQGGDTGQMRALASKLQSVSSRLTTMRGRLDAQLQQVDWRGADADRFREEWHGRFVPALSKMTNDLSSAASAITRDAIRQDQASR